MGYYIDLEKISIDDYQEKLATAYLPPSRLILKDRLSARFDHFRNIGIKNVKELFQLLKKKEEIAKLSLNECFSDDYLTILLRELKSIHPKPNRLKDFSEIPASTIDIMEDIGITNTEKLYYKTIKTFDRQQLAESTGIAYDNILMLTKLSDLSRIKWVGATYAQLLYDLGADTTIKVSKSDTVELHEKINLLIKQKSIFKGSVGLNDVKILVATAKELPIEIEY